MAANAADQARKYLQEREIPILFESLMTALMYHKPDDPVDFMLRGLWTIKNDQNLKVSWDTFIDTPPPPMRMPSRAASANARRLAAGRLSTANEEPVRRTPPPKSGPSSPGPAANANATSNAPIVILLGGPGGRKSAVAEEVGQQMADRVAHLSVPNAIADALDSHGDLSEWKDAAEKYKAGQPIPDDLVLDVVKAEISKQRGKLIILDGYPRTLQQVDDFEREVRKPDMAVIIDFDEDTLRKDLEHKNLDEDAVAWRMQEYKINTLPAAKHYDDTLALHLIAGEQSTDALVEQLKSYVQQALRGPVNESIRMVGYEAANGDRLPPRDVPVIIVIGAPGSMKGEYCRRLVKRYDGFVHLSMGELLKRRAAADDAEAKSVAESLSKGELVASKICGELIFNAMSENPESWGFVLEGYPRQLAQAEEFESRVRRTDLVLLIDCTEQFCLNNLRDRLSDDDEELAKQRVATFKQHTLPMLKYYDEKGKLRVVEGDRDLDDVFRDVVQALDGVFIPQESTEGKSLSNAD